MDVRLTPNFNNFCLRRGQMTGDRCQLAPRPASGVLTWLVTGDRHLKSDQKITCQISRTQFEILKKLFSMKDREFNSLSFPPPKFFDRTNFYGLSWFLAFFVVKKCQSNWSPRKLIFCSKHPPIMLIHPWKLEISGMQTWVCLGKKLKKWYLVRGRDRPTLAGPPASGVLTLAVGQKKISTSGSDFLEIDGIRKNGLYHWNQHKILGIMKGLTFWITLKSQEYWFDHWHPMS